MTPFDTIYAPCRIRFCGLFHTGCLCWAFMDMAEMTAGEQCCEVSAWDALQCAAAIKKEFDLE